MHRQLLQRAVLTFVLIWVSTFALTLAAQAQGRVWAWGENSDGQLGNGTYTNSDTPILVAGLSDIASVAAGSSHSLAVSSDGRVWAWGDNSEGQLGIGTYGSPRSTPQWVQFASPAVSVDGGGKFSIALSKLLFHALQFCP